MVVTKELLLKIKDFGLNSYEAKLWTALLSRGVSTAGELSDIANVPRSRTYDVLESLEKKGFIINKLGKPIKYLAVPPAEVVDRLKKHVTEEAAHRSRMLDELQGSSILDELQLLHNQGVELVDPSDMTGSFRGRDSLYGQLETMIKSAQDTVIIATTATGFVTKLEMLSRHIERALKRGVRIQICAPLSGADLSLIPSGVEVRDAGKALNARFVVVDGKEVAFMVMDDADVHPSYDVGVWINSSFFAQSLLQLFELAWNDMKVVQEVKA